jgi:hypothetical protein
MSKAGRFLEQIMENGSLGYYYAYATDDELNQKDAKRAEDEEDVES